MAQYVQTLLKIFLVYPLISENLYTDIKNKLNICSSSFLKLGAIICFTFILNHEVYDRYQIFVTQQRSLAVIIYLVVWVASLAVILYIGFIHNIIARLFFSILIACSTLVSELHYVILKIAPRIESFEMILNERGYFNNAIHTYSELTLLPIIKTICFFIVLICPSLTCFKRKIFYLIPFVPLILINGILYHTSGKGMAGFPAQFTSISVGALLFFVNDDSIVKTEVKIPIKNPKLAKHVVLIVDESIRGDYLDINGNNNVTPYLMSIEKKIINYGIATSGSNCSAMSNTILRLGANPNYLGISSHTIMKNPSIWKFMHQSGYFSTYIDAQAMHGRLHNYMTRNELSLIDRIIQLDGVIYGKDHKAAKIIQELLLSDTPQFIYFNKAGAHFHYEDHYPDSFTPFVPHMEHDEQESINNKQKVINSYKNTVRWTVDEFFKILLKNLDISETLIIYTSDHGQNLLDDNDRTTHCRRVNVLPYEGLVPLFIITGNKKLEAKFRYGAALNFNNASHFQIFPTILTVAGFDNKNTKETYYYSLFEKQRSPLGFTYGPIFGKFGKSVTWKQRFDQKGKFLLNE